LIKFESIFYQFKEISNTEYNLFKQLFENYSKDVRPVKDWNEKLNLTVNVRVKKISSIVRTNHLCFFQPYNNVIPKKCLLSLKIIKLCQFKLF
jgi:hypothetical protein